MNTSRIDGKSASLNDLRAAVLAVPFLAERRLVVVQDALSPYQGRGKQDERENFLSFLGSLPPTTALVLVIPDSKHYKRGWETLHQGHWFSKWVKQAGNRVFTVDCALPTDREMVCWVQAKAHELGGSFTPDAAMKMAEYIGNNTQRASQEIIKLLTYVNFERQIEEADVSLLTVEDKQSDIFKLVDAMGNRDAKAALDMLHLLLEEIDFVQCFGMIVRQFRLILQAREIIDSGGNESDVAKNLNQHPYVAQKITAQSRQFNLDKLESIYHQLLAIDLESKTGGMAGDIAMDVLIARLAQ